MVPSNNLTIVDMIQPWPVGKQSEHNIISKIFYYWQIKSSEMEIMENLTFLDGAIMH